MKFQICLLSIIVIFSLDAPASTPGRITFQGVLRAETGEPQTGTFDFRVQIFPDAASSSAFLDETIEKQIVTSGIFSIEVGNTTPDLATKLAAASEAHVQISVNGTSLPRQRLNSAMYALNAKMAESVPFTGIVGQPSPKCPEGQFVQSISSSGVPQCGSAVLRVNAGDGLAGAPVTTSGTISVDFGKVARADHVHSCRLQLGGVSTDNGYRVSCGPGEVVTSGFCNNGTHGQATEDFSAWFCSPGQALEENCNEGGCYYRLIVGAIATGGRALCCKLTLQ